MDGDAENTLIEDNFYPPQTAMLPLAIKYWPEKGVGDVGCFTKFPCVLAGISEPTDVSAVLEKENRRIRVSSSQPKQVSKAMDKLNNLERSLVCVFPSFAVSFISSCLFLFLMRSRCGPESLFLSPILCSGH